MASSEFKLPRNFVWTQGSASLKQFAETLTPLLPPGGASTLQQVLDNNHDLVDGNNFQGTDAGVDNTGVEVIAIGTGAANLNTGDNVICIGIDAGAGNTGINSILIGAGAGNNNLSTRCVIIGHNAGTNNEGVNSVILGVEGGQGNTISGSFIISNYSLPSYLDYAAADAAISGSGAAGNTYLYHDQTTNSIGAVRL